MTSPEPDGTPSLTQQRISLERQKVIAIVLLSMWGVAMVLAIALLVAGSPNWFTLAGGVVFLVYGVMLLRKAHAAIAAFEREHGVDAGRQL